jgi:hypothetical protein
MHARVNLTKTTPKHHGSTRRTGSLAVRPYHTLLLRRKSDELLRLLPPDCSAALYRLVQRVNPKRTFDELAQDVNVTLAQVIRLALHLVSWHEAIIIHPLCASNVYMVAGDFDLRLLDFKHMEAFQAAFPKQQLPAVLMDFSHPKRLSEHMNSLAHSQEAAEERIKIVQWLLRREMLHLLHTFVFLLAPKQPMPPLRRGGRGAGGWNSASQHSVGDRSQHPVSDTLSISPTVRHVPCSSPLAKNSVASTPHSHAHHDGHGGHSGEIDVEALTARHASLQKQIDMEHPGLLERTSRSLSVESPPEHRELGERRSLSGESSPDHPGFLLGDDLSLSGESLPEHPVLAQSGENSIRTKVMRGGGVDARCAGGPAFAATRVRSVSSAGGSREKENATGNSPAALGVSFTPATNVTVAATTIVGFKPKSTSRPRNGSISSVAGDPTVGFKPRVGSDRSSGSPSATAAHRGGYGIGDGDGDGDGSSSSGGDNGSASGRTYSFSNAMPATFALAGEHSERGNGGGTVAGTSNATDGGLHLDTTWTPMEEADADTTITPSSLQAGTEKRPALAKNETSSQPPPAPQHRSASEQSVISSVYSADDVCDSGGAASNASSSLRSNVAMGSFPAGISDEVGPVDLERGDVDGCSIAYEHVTSAEYRAILRLPAAKDPDGLDRFLRLCQYFRGGHPLEEIMWRENLRRPLLMEVLEAFAPVLTQVTI